MLTVFPNAGSAGQVPSNVEVSQCNGLSGVALHIPCVRGLQALHVCDDAGVLNVKSKRLASNVIP